MIVKRVSELKRLEDQYAIPGNQLVILYGRKGMGKTTLISQFLKDKPTAYYYEGQECDHKLQLYHMNRQVKNDSNKETVREYQELFQELLREQSEKVIIVLDEFHYIIKNSPDFSKTLELLADQKHPVMLLLCSSSIRWVENEMISSFGNSASYISSYIKLKEFTFIDFVNRFPHSAVETCIHINATLGGIPEYLDEWQEDRSIAENLQAIMLNKNSRLLMATQQYLKLELREPAVYNTILSALSEGNRKLNDLYVKTGFSRAKISVYLKHLIQLDLVEKLIPLNEEGKEHVQKGLYRIKDNYFCFWYRFVFPNLSEIMLNQGDRVYEHKIVPALDLYVQEYFADVCTEYLKLMNLHERLSQKFLWWDRWYGKNGTIDILAQSEQGKYLVAKCLWENRKAEPADYEKLLSLAQEAVRDTELVYLFSRGGFTEELRVISQGTDHLRLIGLEEL